MSLFLPESSSQPQSGVASITPANPETTADDIALMQRVLSAASRNPNLIPSDFMAYLIDYVQTSRLSIPIGQVFGFSQYTAQVVSVPAAETRTSSTFGDLLTVGPTLDGLSDGNYVALWGCAAAGNPAVSVAEMGISVNGVAAPGGDNSLTALTSAAQSTSILCFDTFRLAAGGGNKLTAKYLSSDNTFACTFSERILLALRFSNL